ncbi:MAG: ABC transporter ATP-binding protein/permease [Anaerolineae bacterium]|nr:ABC transporter ATP-binding protein/permease [Anaerolineae bacterium]
MIMVIEYMSEYFGMFLGALFLLVIQAICDLSLPDYMSDIVDTGVLSGNVAYIVQVGATMVTLTLLSAACSIAVGYFAARIAANTARDMRADVFKRVQTFSNPELDKFSPASLITRTTNDITQIQLLVVMLVRMLFYASILGTGGAIKAISESRALSWTIVGAILTLVIVILFLFLMVMPRMRKMQTFVDRVNLISRENLEGMLVIRAFNSQKFEENRFDTANRELTENNLFINRAMTVMMPTMMFIMNVTTVLIVWIGAHQIAELQIDVGKMMAFMQYAMQIIMSFLLLSAMFILIPRAMVSADRVKEVIETGTIIKDKKKAVKPGDDFVPDVEFDNVTFCYPGSDQPVLKNISFKARHGQTTAFIGVTGSGKSTLMNLLVRFYDVTGGRILLGGIDIRDMKRSDLRAKIGYVPQKSMLFSGTIKSNLLYADSQSSDENIERAARIAQAQEFISGMPDGYEAHIAQGGSNLSGGQKQRMSIARALVKNAPIYIFDDSFSALDMKTDAALRAALHKETRSSTLLIVAQRVGTILTADQIIVLENGEIVGRGTHHELLKSCEIYREIALSQISEDELEQA